MTERPARAPFDAVLCDVDNVIRSYDPSGLHALERAAGLAEGATAKVAFAPETGLPVLLGRVDHWHPVAQVAVDRFLQTATSSTGRSNFARRYAT